MKIKFIGGKSEQRALWTLSRLIIAKSDQGNNCIHETDAVYYVDMNADFLSI